MPPAIVPAAGEGATGLCNIFLLAIKHLAIFGAFIDGFMLVGSFSVRQCVRAGDRVHLCCLPASRPFAVIILPGFPFSGCANFLMARNDDGQRGEVVMWMKVRKRTGNFSHLRCAHKSSSSNPKLLLGVRKKSARRGGRERRILKHQTSPVHNY